MKRKLLLLALSIIASGSFIAQENPEDELGAWYMLFTTNKISDDLSIHAEVQARYYETFGNFNQLLLRGGLNYHISENAMATLGYGNITTDVNFGDVDGEENIAENRIYQQFVLKNKVGKLAFSHRYRIEQRFIDHPITGKDTQHRARYFLRLTYPLNDQWFLTAYDELFINLQEPLFGQNRLYAAVGYNINSNLAVQAGYLKNHFTGRNFDRLQLGVFLKTDLRKQQTE